MASLDITNVSFKLIDAIDKKILAEHDLEVWNMALEVAAKLADELTCIKICGDLGNAIRKLEMPTK